MSEFARQVETLRPQLMRFARAQLRNDAWAEDAVSETVLAALEKPQSFGGQSQLKTWLVGILKHKLVDQVRRHTRECALERHDDDGGDGLEPELAPEQDQPAPWGDPQASLARTQLLTQLQDALRTLPPQQGRAFVLRECLEAETDEVCRELGVNANHLGVILHRARHKLRAALAPQWRPALAA